MNKTDTKINIRVDKKTKEEAREVFFSLGISTSAGVNMFLRQVIVEKSLPFTPTSDSKKIREKWDTEVREAIQAYKSGKQKGFATARELHNSL